MLLSYLCCALKQLFSILRQGLRKMSIVGPKLPLLTASAILHNEKTLRKHLLAELLTSCNTPGTPRTAATSDASSEDRRRLLTKMKRFLAKQLHE
jgi:hypothetical protein